MAKGDSPYAAEIDEDLMARCWARDVRDSPRRWIQAFYPWGEANTYLFDRKEPKKFQIEVLEEMEDHIRQNKALMAMGLDPKVGRFSISSGRGTGKSALFEGMIPMWFLCTQLGAPCIISANTDEQLKTKTWAELGIWFTLCRVSHWFTKTTEAIVPRDWFKEELQENLKIDSTYYYVRGQLWSKENPGAYAGAHSKKGLLWILAEASGVYDPVWTVGNGFFSDKTLHRYHLVSGNPRTNTGAFYETHHKNRDRWKRWIVDSRTVEGVDVHEANEVVKEYGINSPEACAEVTGQFPDFSDKQFFPRSLINESATRDLPPVDKGAPVILGVDVARQGDDSSVIQGRQGRDARRWPKRVFHGLNNMRIAEEVVKYFKMVEEETGTPPDAINIDVGGGGGVIDILREWGYSVNEINFGSGASEPERWANKRAEMAGACKQWMAGGCIRDDQELKDDLAGPEYKRRGDTSAVILESKDSMKARGLHSPDQADALWLTFAVEVARRDYHLTAPARNGPVLAEGMDYDLFGR